MRLRYGALLCLTGLVACSNTGNQSTNDPSDATVTEQSGTAMRPASLEPRATQSPAPTPAPDDGRMAPAPVSDGTLTADNALRPSDQNGVGGGASRSVDDARRSPTNAAPDNTKVNQRDTKSSALTPMDQSNSESDLKITQQIRQAVMGDGSLSFTAKNVKIITQGGKVTLRGPVNNEQERSNIEAAARRVAGVSQVDNQLEVKK